MSEGRIRYGGKGSGPVTRLHSKFREATRGKTAHRITAERRKNASQLSSLLYRGKSTSWFRAAPVTTRGWSRNAAPCLQCVTHRAASHHHHYVRRFTDNNAPIPYTTLPPHHQCTGNESDRARGGEDPRQARHGIKDVIAVELVHDVAEHQNEVGHRKAFECNKGGAGRGGEGGGKVRTASIFFSIPIVMGVSVRERSSYLFSLVSSTSCRTDVVPLT